MYAVLRRYQFDPKSSKEIAQKLTDGFIPLLRTAPGFVAYYWADTGTGVGTSISVFEKQSRAEESVRLAADFVKKELAGLVGKPDITQGEVTAHS